MNQGQGPQGGGVSQLQQRLTANRMPQGGGPGGQMMPGHPNMQQGGRGMSMQGGNVRKRISLVPNFLYSIVNFQMGMMQPGMGPMRPMQSLPMTMMGGMSARGPPPMYQGPHMGQGQGGSPNVTMMTQSPSNQQYLHSPASQVS